MSDFRPLGPPIRPEVLPPGEKVERTDNKNVWKVDGKRQTWFPENEFANGPYRNVPTPPPIPEVEASPAIDFILMAMERLKDPEFPAELWGTW